MPRPVPKKQSGISLQCLQVLSEYTGYKENTMLVTSDIKFIRQDEKQRWNGEACRASPMGFLVEPDKLDIKRYLRCFLFIMHY